MKRDWRNALSFLIEEVLAPRFICATKITDDLPVHVQVVSLRSFKQSHTYIFSRLIAFAIVARAAAGD